MKSLLSIFFSVLLSNGCSQNEKLEEITLKYEAISRGFFLNISIEKNKFLVQKNSNEKAVELKISDSNWQELAKLYAKIDFEKYNELEGPTQERHFDGKAHANLTIEKEGVTYATKGFDHTIPPLEIKKFVNLILKLSKENNDH